MPAAIRLILTVAVCAFAQPVELAAPIAFPAGSAFTSPLRVTLTAADSAASIYYTLDGSNPGTKASGSTQRYFIPLTLTVSTVIKAIATKPGSVSAVRVESYDFLDAPLVGDAWYRDADGDGRAEKAVLLFTKPLPNSPEKLSFTLLDAEGKSFERTAGKSEIGFAAGSKTRIEVDFAPPLPFGATSIPDSETNARTYRQTDIPLLDGSFFVMDSVPPVIVKAQVLPRTDALPYARIRVRVSESMHIGSGPYGIWAYKRKSEEAGEKELKILRLAKLSDRTYEITVDSTSPWQPASGDSIAFDPRGNFSDGFENTVTRKAFILVGSESVNGIAFRMAANRVSAPKAVIVRGRWLARDPGGSRSQVDARGATVPQPLRP